jgi:UDP-N-acetylglucosamine:LPS N-acetylglucosamine transferase
MRRISIVYFGAGGGHRAAAQALVDLVERQQRNWTVELVDLDQILEPLDPVYQVTGVHGKVIYNWALCNDMTFASAPCLTVFHLGIRLMHKPTIRLLRKQWRESKPDLVLSVVPHYNRGLQESLQSELPGTPFITLLTDLADYPPRFWFEQQDQHFICGTPAAAEQAAALGLPADRIWRTSGMVLHPRFHEHVVDDRAAARRELGLDPELPTGLVLFGGYGSRRMLDIARYLISSRVQMIFLCGRNAKLAAQLRALSLPYPHFIQEFTPDVPFYMGLSDFFVGKPGPGSLSEALAMGLPIIVESNYKTMVQERFNARWIQDTGVGLVIPQFRDLPSAVERLLQPDRYRRMRELITKENNRAVFETLDILEQILASRAATVL